MAMVKYTDTDGIHRTEGSGAVVRSHLYMRRCLCGPWGYLRNRRRRLALEAEGAGTSGRGREIGRGVGSESRSVGGNESEEEVEDPVREAYLETRVRVVGSVGVCRIHRVRAPISFYVGAALRQAQRM